MEYMFPMTLRNKVRNIFKHLITYFSFQYVKLLLNKKIIFKIQFEVNGYIGLKGESMSVMIGC